MRAARINEHGVVEQCIVGTAEWATERLGGTWVNTELKVSAGWTYSPEEGFRSPKPYHSWSWDGVRWVAPVPSPDDGLYLWSEATHEWVPDE